MKYILLIYGAESAWDGLTEEQQGIEYGQYSALSSDLRTQNKLVLADALHPIAQATTVRINNGNIMITDGPFAETKEQLGGYYIVDVKDLDGAIEVAKRIPDVRRGSVEIRPLVVFE